MISSHLNVLPLILKVCTPAWPANNDKCTPQLEERGMFAIGLSTAELDRACDEAELLPKVETPVYCDKPRCPMHPTVQSDQDAERCEICSDFLGELEDTPPR